MAKCSNNCDSCGNCSHCGECCTSLIPMTRKEEKKIRDYIKSNKIEPEFFQNGKDINLQCCFYDRKNKVCKIYEVRPLICRSFKCNRNINDLEKEKELNHERSYWNRIIGDKTQHLTDMRLLFYDDPRSLISNLLFIITDGKMNCTKKDFDFLKRYLENTGQKELASCLKEEYQ